MRGSGGRGLTAAPLQSLIGGDLQTNQTILQEVLQGQGTQAQRDVVSLNTALVLWASGAEGDLTKAAQKASQVISAGLPWKRLEHLKAALDDGNGE